MIIDNCGDGYNVFKDMNSNYKPGITNYCDDGNNVGGDGCDPSCLVENRFECLNGNLVRADSCRDKCGDGVRINTTSGLVTIECDDGNLINDDGCNDNCEVEEDWF